MLEKSEADTEKRTLAEELEGLITTILRGLYKPSADDPLIELTSAQLRMLRALESGAESASAVGEHLCLSVSAITQVANRLENLGLVERTETGGDRRIKPLALTDLARKLLHARDQVRTKRLEAVLNRIESDHRAEIILALRTLTLAWAEEREKDCIPVEGLFGEEASSASTEELSMFARLPQPNPHA